MRSNRGRSTPSGAVTRLVGFALIPLVSALSPLVVIPALTATFGAETWGTVALAQSIGSAAAVVIELGWGLNGPQRVARASERARPQLYALALSTKLLIFVPVVVPAVVLTVLLAPTDPVVAALITAATALSTLSPSWFFIGTGQPRRILLLDALPRLLTNVVAFLAISFAGAPLLVYPALLFVGTALPPVLGWAAVGSSASMVRSFGLKRVVRCIRAQSVALQGRLASAAYIALPIAIVGAASPSALVLFSAAERLQRLVLALLSAFPNAMQGWVGSSDSPSSRRRRLTVALRLNIALGLVAGLAFWAFGGLASRLLFSGEIDLPYHITALCGGVIAITCVSRATGGLGLVAVRRIDALRNSALVGAMVGPLAIWVLAASLGSTGGLLAELLTESIVLSVQAVILYRALRRASNEMDG